MCNIPTIIMTLKGSKLTDKRFIDSKVSWLAIVLVKGGMMMKKTSYIAKYYGIDRNALTAYIRRHPELFDGHTEKAGREIVVDDEGMKVLEEKYGTQVVTSQYESELIELHRKITELLEQQVMDKVQIITLQDHLRESEGRQMLLEDTQSKLKQAENDRETARKEVSDIKVQADAYKVEMERLQAEVERLKHRTFWQRVFNA